MVTDDVLDPLQRRLRLATLGYLLLYPLPWLQQPPSAAGVAASLAGLGLFLPLYFRAWYVYDWRRMASAASMFAIGIALHPFHGMWTVYIVYAASAAAFAKPSRAAVAGVAGVLIGTALCGLLLGIPVWEWGIGVFFAAIIGSGSLVVGAIKQRDAALALAREESRHLAVVAERERIARDLHDVLGHTLTLVAVKADLARRLIERDGEGARRELDEIHAAARTALGEVRSAVSGMRSTTLAAELAVATSALASSDVKVDVQTTIEPMPPLIEVALAYIVREAATNVIRHAGARHCTIALSRDRGTARLEISDDGRGHPGIDGHGVNGMRQRMAAVGGTLEILGGQGTVVRAQVPLPAVNA